jgi:hypothetical protein
MKNNEPGGVSAPAGPGTSPARKASARKVPPTNIAALAALVCLVIGLFETYITLPDGVPPDAIVFFLAALIFSAVWWSTRRTSSR